MTTTSHIVQSAVRPEHFAVACKNRVQPAAQTGSLPHVNSFWQTLLDWIAPLGYEDETGFHYGEMPYRLVEKA